MEKPNQIQSNNIESIQKPENDKEKYLHFGKFTRDCPQWILDKVTTIDNSKINEEYVKKVLSAIIDEFDSTKHEITSTNDIKISRFITAADVLEKRQFSCGSLATVVASVLRNLQIPTKLIHGKYIRYNPNMRHAWNEVNIDGDDWKPVDITLSKNEFELDEFHIKIFEALDWEEFENKVDKF